MNRKNIKIISILFCILALMIVYGGCTVPAARDDSHSDRFRAGISYPATVERVIDGDTFEARFTDGTTEKVRLLGVDTPEKTAEGNIPGEYGSITDTAYLAGMGNMATVFSRAHLEGKEVVLECDAAAGTRDRYGRLLAYATLPDGSDTGALLLGEGLARVYTAGTFYRRDSYLVIQESAISEKTGIWSYSGSVTVPLPTPVPIDTPTAGVFIASVIYDAGGDDRMNVNGEYIVIGNAGPGSTNLSGWSLCESGGFCHTFAPFTLSQGSSVTLHAGNGSSNDTDLYWGRSSPVLNNDHDTVVLRDPVGKDISSFSWGRDT
jgi:Micrococcal nuclease (thermonuclease) homologs